MKIRKSSKFILLGIIFVWTSSFVIKGSSAAEGDAAGEADDDNFEYHTITTKNGLTYRVPVDMPIEVRNGIEAPIPFDEYVYGKLRKEHERIKAVERRVILLEKLYNELAAQKKAVAAAPAPSAESSKPPLPSE